MNKGRCLCGSVTWELLAEPYAIYNCHCRMCQKAHGAAFGTYCFVNEDQIRWTGSTDTIVYYESSEYLVRSSCDVCVAASPGNCWRNRTQFTIAIVACARRRTVPHLVPIVLLMRITFAGQAAQTRSFTMSLLSIWSVVHAMSVVRLSLMPTRQEITG